MEVKSLVVGPIQTNCYILVDNKEMAIIDPGGDEYKVFEELEKYTAKLKFIINTHFHFDHTLLNNEIRDKYKAEILIHEDEKDYINFEKAKYIKEGDRIEIGDSCLEVIHTPGHSPGGICLLGDNMIFTGDTLFFNTYGRTDLPGSSSEAMRESLNRLADIIKPGMMVYPGHGEIYEVTLN